MRNDAQALARELASKAEAVCRHYLPNGRREGRYWLVGDVDNTPGRSLFVRLHGPAGGRGAAGRWTDAATGEYGDLLDLIAANRGLRTWREAFDEARAFLSLPRAVRHAAQFRSRRGSPEAARRLFARSRPIAGTLAETYLRSRGIADLQSCAALRFHPRCWYRGDPADPRDRARDAWPALIAAVTDLDGTVTGVQRTWLDPSGKDKAPVSTPRRALGRLFGMGVRFGHPDRVLVAGEGIETVLSLKSVMPAIPMVAALSAGCLAALELPPELRRLYVSQDDDPAGRRAAETLSARARAAGVEAFVLRPALGDFNDDLRRFGPDAMAAMVRSQLAPEDVSQLMGGVPTNGR
jgi:hypothetical protein